MDNSERTFIPGETEGAEHKVIPATQFLEEAERIDRDWGFRKPDNLEVISTGIPSLDEQLRIGGIPRGYITEIVGGPAAGKSVLTWHIITEACKADVGWDGCALIMDTDRSLAVKYMEAIGVSFDKTTIVRAKSITQVHEVLNIAVSNGIDLVILDSLAALPEASKFAPWDLATILDITHQSETAVVITNQYRTYNGRQRPMYEEYLEIIAPISIDIKMRESILRNGDVIGHEADLCVTRNRFAFSSPQIKCRLIYGEGIDLVDSWIDTQLHAGTIIQRGGGWYECNNRQFHGRAALRDAIIRASMDRGDSNYTST